MFTSGLNANTRPDCRSVGRFVHTGLVVGLRDDSETLISLLFRGGVPM